MSKATSFYTSLSWLSASNQTQLNWARTYLIKHGVPEPLYTTNQPLRDLQHAIGQTYPNPIERELIERKMTLAWRQKKYRAKNKHKKAYTFELSHKAARDLNDLASLASMPKNQMLEQLILDADSIKLEIEDALWEKLYNKKISEIDNYISESPEDLLKFAFQEYEAFTLKLIKELCYDIARASVLKGERIEENESMSKKVIEHAEKQLSKYKKSLNELDNYVELKDRKFEEEKLLAIW